MLFRDWMETQNECLLFLSISQFVSAQLSSVEMKQNHYYCILSAICNKMNKENIMFVVISAELAERFDDDDASGVI